MSATDPKFEDILSRYLDGNLGEREEQELARFLSDASCSERFLEMTRLNAEIAGLSSAPVPDDVMIQLVLRDLRHEPDPTSPFTIPPDDGELPSTSEQPRTSTRSRLGTYALRTLALAGCFCLLAVALSIFSNHANPAVGSSVAALSGKVLFTGSSGQVALTGDQALQGDGKIQTIGPDSHVTLQLADGTRFELEGDTTLEIQLSRAKPRIFLKEGCFHAQVAKQGEGRALLFDTLNAEATVHGTEFTLLWHQSSTYLMVTEGAVGIRRLTDGPELVVNAGNYCHIEPTGIYHTWPKNDLPKWFNSGAPLDR